MKKLRIIAAAIMAAAAIASSLGIGTEKIIDGVAEYNPE